MRLCCFVGHGFGLAAELSLGAGSMPPFTTNRTEFFKENKPRKSNRTPPPHFHRAYWAQRTDPPLEKTLRGSFTLAEGHTHSVTNGASIAFPSSPTFINKLPEGN
jgi:hypothetical protein